jgi:hypothetical protein
LFHYIYNLNFSIMKKTTLYVPFFIVLLLLISGCEKDKGSLEIKLNPTFGNEVFDVNKWFVNDAGDSLRFTVFKLYLADISLKDDKGKSIIAKDIAYFNINQTDPKVLSVLGEKVKTGSYSKVGFSFGLNDEQNNTDPSSVDCPNPLCADNDMWWGSTLKYTHIKLEGNYKKSGSGTNGILLYHVGLSSNRRDFEFSKSININEDSKSELIINLDIKTLLGGSNPFNLLTENVTQTTDEPAVASKFANKFGSALSIP